MGLDMYLHKRHYVKNWDFMKPEERHEVTVKIGGTPHSTINPEKVCYVVEEVGYWRKANAIHKWFVDNVQEGQDDCKEYWVSREKLEELLELCKKIKESAVMVDTKLRNGYSFTKTGKKKYNYVNGKALQNSEVAQELLPSQSGFFFGSTDYDEYYMMDVDNTINILEEELSIQYPEGFGQPEYLYQSSW